MTVYGAQLILTETAQGHGMEYARDLALQMQAQGLGKVLNQFGNTDNPLAHIRGTGRKSGATRTGKSRILSARWARPTITGTSTF